MKKEEPYYILINSEEITNVYADDDGVPCEFYYDGSVYALKDELPITSFSREVILKDGQAVRGVIQCVEAVFDSLDGIDSLDLDDLKIDIVIKEALRLLTNKYK